MRPPCRDCQERKPGCHDQCERYQSFHEQRLRISAERQKDYQVEQARADALYRSARKAGLDKFK